MRNQLILPRVSRNDRYVDHNQLKEKNNKLTYKVNWYHLVFIRMTSVLIRAN